MHDYVINSVTRDCPDYPALLNKISGAPDRLYYLGDFKPELFNNTLAVVGSRAVTMYGEWVVNTIIKTVAQCGITIVSGFMYGIDALAHKAALGVGGTTVAVMAGGVDYIFPQHQADLYWEIAQKGMVISEYHRPDFGGKWMFAKRNRIVAGLSSATLVVEAGQKSGSLITAGFAKEYGRQLFAVPGNLNAPNSFGTLQLLKNGATMVTCADDILKHYFPYPNNYRQKARGALNKRLKLGVEDGETAIVAKLLHLEPLSVDELAQKSQLSVASVLRAVTGLGVLGHIKEEGGKYYVN